MRRKKAEITSTTHVILLHLGAVILPRLIAFLHSGFLFLHLDSSYASSGAHYVKRKNQSHIMHIEGAIKLISS